MGHHPRGRWRNYWTANRLLAGDQMTIKDYQVEAAVRYWKDHRSTKGGDLSLLMRGSLEAAHAAQPPKHEHQWSVPWMELQSGGGEPSVNKESSSCPCGATKSVVTTITEAPQGADTIPVLYQRTYVGSGIPSHYLSPNTRSGKERFNNTGNFFTLDPPGVWSSWQRNRRHSSHVVQK